MAVIKVAAIQLKPQTDGTIMGVLRDRTMERGLKLVSDAASLGAKIVCFPAFLPNVGKPSEITPAFADEGNKVLCAEARKHRIFLIAGCVTRLEKKYAVEELFIDPEGRVVGMQRKIHLRADDERILVPGEKFRVFETEIGRIGIAENLYYPEVLRILALSGVEIAFAPSNQFVPELETWQTLVMARAAENLLPIVGVNPALWRTRADLTSGQKDTPQGGGSLIVDIDLIRSIEGVPLPRIKILAQAGQDEEVLTADIDLEKATEARRYWLTRRRPELYGLLCS